MIYLIINIKKLDKTTIWILFKNIIFILLITMFYWLPLLEIKLNTEYEVFNQNHMVRYDAMIILKPSFWELLFQKEDRLLYGLGIAVLLGTIISLFAIKKIKDKKNYVLFMLLGIICTIMSLDIFPFEKLPKLFTMMQFSFRMLEFASFFLVVVATIAFDKILKKFNIYTVIFLTSLSLLFLLPSVLQLHYGIKIEENKLEYGIRITNSTGRVHPGCASFEYLPTKAFKNRKYIEEREDKPVVLNTENYTIENYTKNGTNCSLEIKSNENVEIELPYIYYIGYNVKYNGKVIKTHESENGFLAVNIESPNGLIEVRYTGTNIMKITYIVSLSTCIICIIYVIRKSFINKQK